MNNDLYIGVAASPLNNGKRNSSEGSWFEEAVGCY